LAVANALWGRKGEEFRKEYIDLVAADYGGGLQTLDFGSNPEGARQTINGWVEDNTQHKIKDLIPSKDLIQGASLVLTNAIYFKGNWAVRFKAEKTKTEPFTLADGKQVDKPLMHQTGKFFYAEDDECQLLEMPYAGDDVVMTILLPRKPEGLAVLEKTLDSGGLTMRLAKRVKREVAVTLPKFKVTSTFQLNQALAALGMNRAFQPDFAGMTVKPGLFIGPVLHKAFVDVNEEGTEAAAATAVIMMRSSIGPQPGPVVFRADHPFLFLIRHARSESILFMGRLMTPEG
jgi:serpin B